MNITNLVIWKVMIVIFVVVSVTHCFYSNRGRLNFIWFIWKRFRPKMLLEVLGVLFLIIAAIVIMWQLPFLRWGWWNLLSGGNVGNILIAPILEGSQSSYLFVRILVPCFFLFLIVVFPFLAKMEEEIFRQGHYKWKSILKQSIKFGLFHLFAGVPLSAAFALIGAGFFFGYKYRRAFIQLIEKGWPQRAAEEEAVLVSTTYHTLHNTILISFLLFFVITAI